MLEIDIPGGDALHLLAATILAPDIQTALGWLLNPARIVTILRV